MLINGSFEEGYQPDIQDGVKLVHLGYVFEVKNDSGPIVKRYTTERGELANPLGWFAWYKHQKGSSPVSWDPDNTIGYSEPEVRLTIPEHNRQKDGNHACCLFTYRRIHEMGLLQTVYGFKPGDRLHLSAYAHGWVGDDTKPPECSLPGCGGLVWEDVPGLNDDQSSIWFAVGIDPLGGKDPYAESVVWGNKRHIFNEHQELTCDATAQGDSVTVFLMSSSKWRVPHNDAYWDSVTLEKTRSYDVKVNVVPQDTTLTRVTEIVNKVFPSRESLTYSHDDAARIATLPTDTVVLWDIQPDRLQEFKAWYRAHGSNATLVLGTHEKRIFSQRDPRWAKDRLGNTSYTIGNSGCAITCVSMIAKRTPKEMNSYLTANGGYDSEARLYWKVAAVDGLSFVKYHQWLNTAADLSVVRRCLEKNPCPVKVKFNPNSKDAWHFVLGVRFTDNGEDLVVYDPWTGTEELLLKKYARPSWNLERAIYAIAEYVQDSQIIVPPQDPPGEKIDNPIGLHLQEAGPWDSVLEYVRNSKPYVMKIFDSGLAEGIKLACPETKVVLRHHIDNDGIARICQDPVNGTAWFFDQIGGTEKELLEAGKIDYLETPNNEANSVGFTTAAWARADIEFVKQLKQRFPNVKPVVATISVGCPGESEYTQLVDLAKITKEAGGAFGYHGYWPSSAQGCFLESDWKWHAGRWTEIDKVLSSYGVKIDWILTESGPCGGEMQTGWFAYDPGAGWKSTLCCNDDWTRARSEIMRFKELIKQWNSTNGNRCLGAVLFTTCGWGWEYFRLWDSEIRSLAL